MSYLSFFLSVLRMNKKFFVNILFIDLLKRSKPSRIVVVASELYRIARLNFNNINPTTTLPAYLYYVSKYANIVFTLELARRLVGTGVTANCLHPGMIDSGIWRNVPAPLSWFLNIIIKAFFKTPQQAAQTTIYLAVSNEVNGVTGKYFMDCAVRIIFFSLELLIVFLKFFCINFQNLILFYIIFKIS